MAVRNLLHMDELEEFEKFLEIEGYMILPLSKNPYEALRAKKGKDTIIIYRRSDAREHLSIMDKDYKTVKKFLSEGKKEGQTTPYEVVFEEERGLPWE